uniref:Uncharacterized protein n=1 Tax=Moniliophthora roreri TaxID=221103 RepID=A0A0W0GBH3_MONRR
MKGLKAHLWKLIANPDLVLGSEAQPEECMFDHYLWESPEGFYTIHSMKSQLPHLQEIFVAFFEGALETWEHFTAEYKASSWIVNATDAQKQMESCHLNASGQSRAWKVAQAQYDCERAAAKVVAKAAQVKQQEEHVRRVWEVEAILDIAIIQRHEFMVPMLDVQLAWHQDMQNNTSISGSLKKIEKKVDKVAFLIRIIEEYLSQQQQDAQEAVDKEDVEMDVDEEL